MIKNLKIDLSYDKTTLIDKIEEIIEKALLNGDILPGERISEARLAKEIGVSRVPVREALIRLEQSNIVKKTYRGREVVRFESEELRELNDVKVLLEVHSAKIGCKLDNKRIKKNLKEIVDRMDQLLAAKDYTNLQGTNYKFHNLLVKSANNKKLYDIYINVAKQIRWTTHFAMLNTDTSEPATKEHREIYEAFVASDVNELTNLIEKHGKRLLNSIIKATQGK